jgi:hypothetical protein
VEWNYHDGVPVEFSMIQELLWHDNCSETQKKKKKKKKNVRRWKPAPED